MRVVSRNNAPLTLVLRMPTLQPAKKLSGGMPMVIPSGVGSRNMKALSDVRSHLGEPFTFSRENIRASWNPG